MLLHTCSTQEQYDFNYAQNFEGEIIFFFFKDLCNFFLKIYLWIFLKIYYLSLRFYYTDVSMNQLTWVKNFHWSIVINKTATLINYFFIFKFLLISIWIIAIFFFLSRGLLAFGLHQCKYIIIDLKVIVLYLKFQFVIFLFII